MFDQVYPIKNNMSKEYQNELKMWRLYVVYDCDPDLFEKTEFLKLMEEVSEMYCLDPSCRCSKRTSWEIRSEDDEDGFPPNVKEVLWRLFCEDHASGLKLKD